jgi:AraC-like DNA-binding protein
MIILVAQGKKQSILETEGIVGKNQHIYIGVDLPSEGRILEATPEKPCLMIRMNLDTSILSELLAVVPFFATAKTNDESVPRQGMAVVDTDPCLLDAFLRLIELLKPDLKSPAEQTALAPLIIRELHYRLLHGPLGNRLRMMYTQDSKNYRITQAIRWLKINYTQPLHINELANMANMALPTFRRHFQQLTTMSPLQYQKRLRLYESQRLMLTERIDATHAAYSVGYVSINQFNREYKRMFGEPPGKNIKRLLTS